MLFLIVNSGLDSGGDVDHTRGMDHLVKSIEQAERCIAGIIRKRGRHIKADISRVYINDGF